MNNLINLENLLEEELGLCLIVYRTYMASDRERRLMVAVWLDAIADACAFEGWEQVLCAAFRKHRQEAEKFPTPSQIRPALLEARYKQQIGRQRIYTGENNGSNGLGLLYYRAWCGDKEAEELIKKAPEPQGQGGEDERS